MRDEADTGEHFEHPAVSRGGWPGGGAGEGLCDAWELTVEGAEHAWVRSDLAGLL